MDKNPETSFTLSVYFLSLTSLFIPALCAFVYICSIQSNYKDEYSVGTPKNQEELQAGELFIVATEKTESEGNKGSFGQGTEGNQVDMEKQFFKRHYVVLLLQLLNSALGYGLCPSIVSSAASKFKEKKTILLFSTAVSCIVDPFCRAMTEYLHVTTVKGLSLLSAALVILSSILVVCTSLNTDNILYTSELGGILPASSNILFVTIFGFTNTSIFRYFKVRFFLFFFEKV
jgi:hypothetical protein